MTALVLRIVQSQRQKITLDHMPNPDHRKGNVKSTIYRARFNIFMNSLNSQNECTLTFVLFQSHQRALITKRMTKGEFKKYRLRNGIVPML